MPNPKWLERSRWLGIAAAFAAAEIVKHGVWPDSPAGKGLIRLVAVGSDG